MDIFCFVNKKVNPKLETFLMKLSQSAEMNLFFFVNIPVSSFGKKNDNKKHESVDRQNSLRVLVSV